MAKFKVTLLTGIGAGLEYYDFVIYALLANYLSILFFANEDPLSGLLKVFAIFAIGYVVRPLGGMLFGSRSDRLGRKKNFIITLLLMAVSTLAIGLLPTYQHLGIGATLLLILFRTLQGIAYGAEMPGAITFMAEHSKAHYRGYHCSMMMFGVGVGSSLASLVVTVLSNVLTQQQMLSFGWRIPFCLGGVLAIIGGLMRRQLDETPLYLRTQPLATPLAVLLQTQWRNLLVGIGLTLLAGCLLLFYLYLPAFFHQLFNYPLAMVYRALTIGIVVSTVLLPLFGWLSDYVGRKRQLQFTVAIILLSIFSLFNIASAGTYSALLWFVFLYHTMVAALAACYPSMLAELFPTEVRHSGVAVCYNVAYAIAGVMPVLAGYLLQIRNKPESLCLLIVLIATLTMWASIYYTDRTRQELT